MEADNDPMLPIEGSKKKGLWKPEYSRFRRGGTGAGKGDFNRSLDAKQGFDEGYDSIDWSR